MRTATISAILALAIGIAPISARPANALTDTELLALLAGIAAVAVIGKEIRDKRKEESRAPQVSQRKIYGHGKNHGQFQKRNRRLLPAQCLRMIERPGRDDRRVLGARCLERNDVRLSRLPDDCLLSVRTNRGYRDAYGARCVQRNGWTIENTRHWSR